MSAQSAFQGSETETREPLRGRYEKNDFVPNRCKQDEIQLASRPEVVEDTLLRTLKSRGDSWKKEKIIGRLRDYMFDKLSVNVLIIFSLHS